MEDRRSEGHSVTVRRAHTHTRAHLLHKLTNTCRIDRKRRGYRFLNSPATEDNKTKRNAALLLNRRGDGSYDMLRVCWRTSCDSHRPKPNHVMIFLQYNRKGRKDEYLQLTVHIGIKKYSFLKKIPKSSSPDARLPFGQSHTSCFPPAFRPVLS